MWVQERVERYLLEFTSVHKTVCSISRFWDKEKWLTYRAFMKETISLFSWSELVIESKARRARVSIWCHAERARAAQADANLYQGLYIYIYIYIYIYLIIGYVTRQWRAHATSCMSLPLLCFSRLQWLTRDFKHETFGDHWIPLYLESEFSMREQGERRLQARKEWLRTDSIHIDCKRVCKIV